MKQAISLNFRLKELLLVFSLLNTDLKIASAAIANRFKQVLGGIISDAQKCFMNDRFMGENTRLLYGLMHYLEENDMDGLLLLVDFEKAFDSIDI